MPTLIVPLSALVLAGCASLDPTADIDRAASLVADRAGEPPGWDAPWDTPAPHWDAAAPLSAPAAVRTALQNNRAIRKDVETIVATRADYVQAHLLPNPVINLAFGFPTDGLGGEPLSAAIVQQLARLWTRGDAIDAADADLRTRVLAVSDAALRLVADVRTAHADVVLAERTLALADDNVALAARSADLVGHRYDVGEASRLDVNRVTLARLGADNTRVERAATLDRAKRRLLALLGRAAEHTGWHTDDVIPATPPGLDESAVTALAASMRLDVAAAEITVEAHASRVGVARAERAPDVAVGVGYQRNFSNRGGVFPSVSVTPKLFDDGSAAVARAASRLRQAEIEADRVRQTAIAEARQAWVTLAEQRHLVAAYEDDILHLARSSVDLARASYDAGESDLTVLLDAQRALNDARIALADRRRAAVSQRIELERAVGGLLDAPAALPAHAAGAPRRMEVRP